MKIIDYKIIDYKITNLSPKIILMYLIGILIFYCSIYPFSGCIICERLLQYQ